MAYVIEKDERKIEYKEDKFYINIDQVQIADPTNFIAMVEAWREQKTKAEEFIVKDAEHLEAAKARVELQHKQTIDNVSKELANIKVSLTQFEPVLEKYKTDNPALYEEQKKKLEESKAQALKTK